MTEVVEFDEMCQSCGGTGLYVGMAERDGAAVVCTTCGGTGCHHFKHEYVRFKQRANPSRGVTRVFEVNPGIAIGRGNGHELSDFGGMPVKEWEAGLPFPKGSENRRFTCPLWWYQSADYKREPHWKKCAVAGSFSACKHFADKARCWADFDAGVPNDRGY